VRRRRSRRGERERMITRANRRRSRREERERMITRANRRRSRREERERMPQHRLDWERVRLRKYAWKQEKI
jgi:hypothetical protein